MRVKLFIFFVILPISLFGLWISLSAPGWKATIQDIATDAENAGMDKEAWQALEEKSESLPDVYPLNIVHSTIKEAQEILALVEGFQPEIESIDITGQSVPTEKIRALFRQVDAISIRVKTIRRKIASIPDFALGENEKAQKEKLIEKVRMAEQILYQHDILRKVFEDFVKREERVLILLQNQNEPRPTGGFVGSVAWLNFNDTDIRWDFQDIYALDRNVPEDAKLKAPLFFEGLNPRISLRDANIYPDFPTSAEAFRTFFQKSGMAVPDTILALNLNVVETLLDFTGPVTLDTWNVELTKENFDMVLSFLVEAKVAGRFGVKEPVLLFAKEIFKPEHWKDVDTDKLLAFDRKAFHEQKNILAYSKESQLQRLFEVWDIDGALEDYEDADNMLYADFVSVGANKSEKFMWTKIWHNSRINANGRVLNTIEIERRHHLRPGELDGLLGTANWFENLRDLLTDDIRWTLGAGQSRTVLRLYVPTDARLIQESNPSGPITTAFSNNKKFKILEVPMYVSPGEKNDIKITYETNLKRGSHNWRPYVMKVGVTPGKKQTSFLQTISSSGKFEAETKNIGRPLPMKEDTYRAVVNFQVE